MVTPFAGKVAEVNIKAGEWVETGQPAIGVVDDSHWVVETDDLTELQVPAIQAGQSASLIPDALPELGLVGEVESIKPLYQEKRGDITYLVHILLKEADPRLRWGMTVSVKFETSAR